VTTRQDDSPDLDFAVTGVRALDHAAVPTLAFALAVSRSGGGPIRSVTLTTAIRIAVARRHYSPGEQAALAQLFGPPQQWATSLQPLAWTRLTTAVPAFDTGTEVELPVACSCEMELAVTKYLHAVREGEVPLDFLFSGTVFHKANDGRLRTAQIPWSKEARWRLPAPLWHELADHHFGGGRWLRLSQGAYDRLNDHRARHMLGGWDEAVHTLLDRATAPAPCDAAGA
jgi:hypothetical protein